MAFATLDIASDVNKKNDSFTNIGNQNVNVTDFLVLATMSLSVYVNNKLQQVKQEIDKTDSHHIVAQKSRFAEQGRAILRACGIGINDEINRVDVKRGLHWILHTRTYYSIVV